MTALQTGRILVTGGTGFAGSHLVQALNELGCTDIHSTSLSKTNDSSTQHAQIHQVDLTNPTAVDNLFKQVQPTHIFHLASFAAVGSAFTNARVILNNNINLQLNVLESMQQHAPHAKMVAIFSAEVYAPTNHAHTETDPVQPSNPYGISKATQEMLTLAYQKSFNLNIVCARPFNHLGERQSPDFAVSSFAKQIAEIEKNKRQQLAVGNLSAQRDFTDVKDTVQAYIRLMTDGISGDIYNVGSGKATSMQTVLDMLLSLSETKINPVADPTRLRPADVPIVQADITKIKKLGWQPKIELHSTLARVLNYWRDQI